MADLISPTTITPSFLKPVPTVALQPKPAQLNGTAGPNAAADPAALARLAAAKAKAKDAGDRFESQFMSTMMQSMFQGISTDGPFDGGFGEEMFRSVLTDAMAKQMTKAGGVGVSAAVQHEILKMQGLQ